MVVDNNIEWTGNIQVHQPVKSWAAQAMRLPVSWYESIESGSGVGYEVSGDATTKAKANPPMFFAPAAIAHGSRPLPLRA